MKNAKVNAWSKTLLSRFKRGESGAVTVDFLVMTSVIVVLGTVVVSATRGGTEKISADINTELSAVPVSG